jgi:hypothetical protein
MFGPETIPVVPVVPAVVFVNDDVSGLPIVTVAACAAGAPTAVDAKATRAVARNLSLTLTWISKGARYRPIY